MLDQRVRAQFEQRVRPVGDRLRRAGITADHLTGAGLVISVVAAFVIGSGRLGLGVVALAGTAVSDLLDGAVAKASGRVTARGAFFDSVVDRVSDSLVLGGLAWYYASRQPHIAVLVLAVLALSTLISYERARAEGLGFDARGGLMERAERVVALAIGLAIRPILVPVLWVMLVLTAITALQRFLKVWRQASPTMPEHPAERRLAGTRLARWWRARSEGPPRSGAQRWRTRRGPRVRP